MSRQPTRLDQLQQEARQRGLYVRTWSPGDGVTRYRFFEAIIHDACQICGHDAEWAGGNRWLDRGGGSECLGYYDQDGVWIERASEHQADRERSGYFGPDNGTYTALGLKEAYTYLAGRPYEHIGE